jgi:hypothetical protein
MFRGSAHIPKTRLFIAAAIINLAVTLPAWAALGGNVASVQADQVRMQASLRTTASAAYNVHEMQTAAGGVVREYVSSEGKVFAITWNGPWPPDLRQLLGAYFDQYSQAAMAQREARIGRRPLVINEPGLVVQAGGHPRSFTGKAYVPQILPAGVRAEDIQ